MSEARPNEPAYLVTVHQPKDLPEVLVFTFVPKVARQAGSESSGRAPRFIAAARTDGTEPGVDWSQSPDDPAGARPELESEVRRRVEARAAWIGRISDLVARVEAWGRELGWATRRISKRLDDSLIGTHEVPALLMQEGTCRVLLEPIGRSAPGADGVADLYLMPAYDDIASLYFHDDGWHLHYCFEGGPSTRTVREAAGIPLSKETLQRVLGEMTTHAA